MRGYATDYDGGSADTGWIEVVPGGGWVNYSTDETTLAYRRMYGVVHWKGLIRDGAANATIVTVPAGFLPSYGSAATINTHWQTQLASSGGTNVASTLYIRKLDSSLYLPSFGGAGTWVSLNGLSYPASG